MYKLSNRDIFSYRIRLKFCKAFCNTLYMAWREETCTRTRYPSSDVGRSRCIHVSICTRSIEHSREPRTVAIIAKHGWSLLLSLLGYYRCWQPVISHPSLSPVWTHTWLRVYSKTTHRTTRKIDNYFSGRDIVLKTGER